MNTIDRAKAIHAKAEQAARAIFAPSAAASDEATIATAEGLLAGIAEILVQRVGVERSFQIVSRQGDILDRVLLDTQAPRRPTTCGND
jgi:hypothetical protein